MVAWIPSSFFLEDDEGSQSDFLGPKVFVFPNITFVLIVQSKWRAGEFLILKHF